MSEFDARAIRQLNLSAHVYQRILLLALMIADSGESEAIQFKHLVKAL